MTAKIKFSPVIRILDGLSGAGKAAGFAVIIDVFRAFSTACYAISKGAKGILPVARIKEAFSLHRQHPDWILMGERNGIKVDGFDLGNSPKQINEYKEFNGRMIIQATSNGTRGISAVKTAQTVITGSFVNARAVATYAHRLKPQQVDLVCMGTSLGPSAEDSLCAAYIADLIKGKDSNLIQMLKTIAQHPTSQRFLTGTNPHCPKEDLSLCLAADIFNFILRRETDSNGRFLLSPHFL